MFQNCMNTVMIPPEKKIVTVNIMIQKMEFPLNYTRNVNILRDIELSRLFIKLSSEGSDIQTDTFQVSSNQQLISHTLAVMSGKNYVIEAWTTGSLNRKVHYGKKSLSPLQKVSGEIVNLILEPCCGSIYIPLANVPKSVDSIFAYFTTASDTFFSAIKCSGNNEALSIDYIPDGMLGKLTVILKDQNKNCIASAEKEFRFDAKKNMTIQLNFTQTSEKMTLSLTIVMHGVTVVLLNFDTTEVLKKEQGGLIISEIHYYAQGDSDYIELYNPSDREFKADSLQILVIGGSSSTNTKTVLYDIAIAPESFYVIGNGTAPMTWVSTNASLKLSSSDKWIVIRRNETEVLDIVTYMSGVCEWPSKKSKYSIVCDSLLNDPEYNNYGRHWHLAKTAIDASDHWGTPGMSGL